VTSDVDDPMAAEFGTVAEWTAQVAVDLGPDYRIPAACRGSGQPAALDWLLNGLAPGPGERLLDVGAGVGGPAAYGSRQTGVEPMLVEPEAGACRAARQLFGFPTVQGDATRLPVADQTVRLAWCLGVLCTTSGARAQLEVLRELRRVVRPGGRIGLLVFLATTPDLDDPPAGNHFPAPDSLDVLVAAAGPGPHRRPAGLVANVAGAHQHRGIRAEPAPRSGPGLAHRRRPERPHRPPAPQRPAREPGAGPQPAGLSACLPGRAWLGACRTSSSIPTSPASGACFSTARRPAAH
jgi:SAM-dependent methyltransferase